MGRKAKMEKQEHMTHLSAGTIVDKTNPRIEFRGRLDSLNASVVKLQIFAGREKLDSLVAELEEIRVKVRDVSRCDVTGAPCEDLFLWGLKSDEIRERSHHPEKYFGLGHILPHHTMGAAAAALNALRTRAREVELSACRAFETPQGPGRPDIVKALNRLSGAIYILTYKYLPQGYDKTMLGKKREGREGPDIE
jgi:ethanolamine utilization cobalamin adenosyltransferase